MNFIVLCNVPHDGWEVLLVTDSIEKAIDKIKYTHANCIEIWEDGERIDDYSFSQRYDWDSEEQYKHELANDIHRFMELMNKINIRKLSDIELKYGREELNESGRKLKIGIALRDSDEIIERFNNTVYSIVNDIKKMPSKEVLTKYGYIETENTIYELIKVDEYIPRGKKFHKIYFDNCDTKFVNEVLKPMTTGGYIGIYTTTENLDVKRGAEEKILNRIEADEALKSVIEKFKISIAEIEDMLAALNVQIKDKTGRSRKMNDVLDELSNKYKKLDQ
ncbi:MULTISPECIES: hypothetical protein [unclassified Clostridium]|uniref:hypothetical protein n=1 Tax=unclassified Clostridium TaxID=2614128 RepID=UPI0025C095FE|nr:MULTISPECIES: hypothetical protein [unclassified Clostridium]